MSNPFDENLRAAPGLTRMLRARIVELRYDVLFGGVRNALEAEWGLSDFLFTVNGASFAAARALIEEFDDPGVIYDLLRDLGVRGGHIEAEGLEGAVRWIASFIHPAKIVEDEHPEHYPKPVSLLACAAELRMKLPGLVSGNEEQIVDFVDAVIPLGMMSETRQTFTSYLQGEDRAPLST